MADIKIQMGQEKSYQKSLQVHRTLRGIVMILLCAMSLFPFLLLIINSTRSSDQIKAGISLIPGNMFVENWKMLMKQQGGFQITIWRAMMNSAIVTIPSTILTVYFSTLTAYSIHTYRYKGKKFMWGFIMGVMMVPTQITIIGFYRFMLKLGLVDTYIPLILPAIAAPNVVFFMRQYMQSAFPLELVEAARIDGSNEFKTFNTIAIPLMKPAIATQAIFAFIASWNNLFTPTVMLTSDSKKTLPMFVQLLTSNQFKTDYGVVYMGLFITIVPLLVVYIFLSKFIVEGVALGGVKE